MFERIRQYALLIRLNKPIGALLLLWPTLWGLWLAANGQPEIKIIIIFILGVFLTRSAGCIINDIADRNFDGHVERTQHRPLASGKISVREALILCACLALMAFLLVLMLNRLTIVLAIFAAAIASIYPLMKRYIDLPQAILGIAYSWGIPMAYAAQTHHIPSIAWLLFIAAAIWSIAYDTMYAMVDRDDDLKIGVRSSAILFGRYDRLIIGILQCAVILLLLLVGITEQLHVIYYCSLITAAAFFIYQQYLIKDRARQRCFKAFLNNNWVGVLVFIGIFVQL